MNVQLGSIVLDDDLVLDGLLSAQDLSVDPVMVMDGSTVLQTMPLSGGRMLSLSSAMDGDSIGGVFLRSQLLDIKSLAAAGLPVTLTHHLGTFTVLITSTADVRPVFDYADPQADDWYVGSIQMIEV